MPPRKRKLTDRDGTQIENTTERNYDAHDVGNDLKTGKTGPKAVKGKTKPKVNLKKAKAAKTDVAEEITEPEPGPPAVPQSSWPEHFAQLLKTHSALNLVYTFCCTKKHLTTTFETIKSGVRGRIGRDITIEEVIEVKWLLGERGGVRLEWVSGGGEAEDDCEGDAKKKMVLLFEFVDNAKGGKSGKKRKGGSAIACGGGELTQAQMLQVITRRNEKFKNAINAFLVKCANQGVDAVEHLKAACASCMPVSPYETSSSATTTPPTESTIPKEIPKERKSITEILDEIKATPDFYLDQIVADGHFTVPAREAAYGDLTFVLSQNLVNALYNARSITQLYTHQVAAINAIHAGEDVIVSTATSSGKSLIYQIPVLHALEKDPDIRAMYIFPTKALAQDQLRGLKELLSWMGEMMAEVEVDTFDGDTKMEERQRIRERARVIFTNPDMLHLSVLPNEGMWRSFLKELRFVVVDELHVYNNLFGVHMAFIMRRLKRLCAAVGNENIRFISCSATVANPEQHMKAIFGVPSVTHISINGSPSGSKQFDAASPTSGRVDTISETARLLTHLLLRGVRTIAFCRIRKACELLLNALRNELQRIGFPDVADRVMAYRGGYTPQDRRQIEREMFTGQLLGIVATNALELGVDIGSLDAVVMMGFPYSIAGMRQQSGRAGRRNKDSLAVLVGGGAPMDRYYMNHPGELMNEPNAEVRVEMWGDEGVAEGHIQCAAAELPIHPVRDRIYFGDALAKLCEEKLIRGMKVYGEDDVYYYHPHPRYLPSPARHVAIRDTEDDPPIAVIDVTNHRNVVLEELEPSRAGFTVYEGGIFLHQGKSYLVKDVAPEKRFARVELVSVEYMTRPRDHTDVWPVQTEAVRVLTIAAPTLPVASHSPSASPSDTKLNPAVTTLTASHGKIRLTTTIYGYHKISPPPSPPKILDTVEIPAGEVSPPIIRLTTGTWIDLPSQLIPLLETLHIDLEAAVHGAEHAVAGALLPSTVRVKCRVKLAAGGGGSGMVFYDPNGGGGGNSGVTSWRVFEDVEGWLGKGVERIEACKCDGDEGCEGCIGAIGSGWVPEGRCYEGDKGMSKKGAAVVLRVLLGREVKV
ncbi:P-loop containing nucleoside triphosphate hydrolase protein [Kalaharituber pfeilii]|nr:P-loop containing nucleoside triphosphate hydrolase protein [Kalaharituber pfeilii]